MPFLLNRLGMTQDDFADRAGEVVIAEPNAEPLPGDDVVITLKDGRKMVKQLLYTRGEHVALGSINESHPIITIHLSEIEKIHRVAGVGGYQVILLQLTSKKTGASPVFLFPQEIQKQPF